MKVKHAIEIVVFYAAMAAVNLLVFPNYPGFVGIDPHPYWLGILLFGFRYGVLAGFGSGLISAALYLGMAWVGIERYLFEDAAFYVLPSLFIIVGVAVGVGVYTTLQKIRDLEQQLADRQTQIVRQDGEIKTLQNINSGLEKRIVTRMQTLITLYEGARSLSTTSLDDLYKSILNFVARTLGAEEAALYLHTDTGWQVKESYGWKDYANHPAHLQTGEGITGLAGLKNKILTVRDFIGKESPANFLADCVMAGPIRGKKEGEVLAVLSIQDIPFLQFNSSTVSLMNFLLDWASRAVRHAMDVVDMQENEIWDAKYQVFSMKYFQSRARQEWLRSKTYYLPLSVGMVKVAGLADLPSAACEKVLAIIAEVLRKTCREMDVVAAHTSDLDMPFALLLVTVSPAQAGELYQKIMTRLSEINIPQMDPMYAGIKIQVGMSHFSPQTQDMDSLIHQAQEVSA